MNVTVRVAAGRGRVFSEEAAAALVGQATMFQAGPRGFPVRIVAARLVEAGRLVEATVDVPEVMLPGAALAAFLEREAKSG